METAKYTVIPRMPIRGIKDTIITEETELELNELELLKVLIMGHTVLDKDDDPVTLKDIVPDVDPQVVAATSLVDDVTGKDCKFVASSECKVFGTPRCYKEPVISLVEKKEDNNGGGGQPPTTPTTPGSNEEEDSTTQSSYSYGY